MEQPEQVAERADRTEKAPLEETPCQYDDHHEAAGKQADLKTCQYGRNSDCRAEVAEIAAEDHNE